MATDGIRDSVETDGDEPAEPGPRVISVVTGITVKEPPVPIGTVSLRVISDTRIVAGPVGAEVTDDAVISDDGNPP